MIPGLNKRVVNFYDLMLYVALVRKHLRLMVLIICACMLAGMAIFLYSRPIYYSRSIVQFESLSLPNDSDSVYHDGNYTSVINAMKGPEVVRRTAARLGINAEPSEIMGKYIRDIRINPNSKGNMDVQVWSYMPSWPAHWTQIMVEEYNKMRAEQRESYRDTITAAYTQDLNHLVQRMDQEEASKTAFDNENNSTAAYVNVTRIGNLPAEIAQATARIDRLNEIRTHLDDPTIDTVAKLSILDAASQEDSLRLGQLVGDTSNSGSNSKSQKESNADNSDSVVVPGLFSAAADWPMQEKRQRELLKETMDLSRTYLPGNQKMVSIHKDLEKVQQNLELDYEVARGKFDMACQSAQEHLGDLQKEIPEFEVANRKYDKIRQNAQLHQAGQLSWSLMFQDEAQTVAKLQYAADKERVNVKFESIPDVRPDPVAPNKFNMAFFSLIAGVILAFVIPFLIEYLDYTLSNVEEVEATFQMRGLGIIPQVPQGQDQPLLLNLGSDESERNLIENFRVVRTNLLAMGTLSKPAHVTMVTSAMPKEGKTVVSSNLAISFSQTGVRTLLIDTDLRRGRLHRLFGLRKSPGLSDYLLGKVSLEEAIRSGGKDNLSILSAGQHVESGTELIGSSKFIELMTHLRGQYERIVMDTPPVLGLSETSVLQSQVDGVLFVIWSGRTPIRNMKTAIDILATNGANFYGFILNRLDLSTTANYYQYYYYSSDYYHSYHALENA